MEIIKRFGVEFDPDTQELFYNSKKYKFTNILISEDFIQFTTVNKDICKLTSENIESKDRCCTKYDIEYTYEIRRINDGSIFSSLNDNDIALVQEKKTNIHYISTGTAYKKQYINKGKHYSLFETVEEFNEYLASDFNNSEDWSYYKLKNTIDRYNLINIEKLYNVIPYVDTYEKYNILVHRLNTRTLNETTDDILNDLMDTFTNESKKKITRVRNFLDSLFNNNKEKK